MTHSLPEIDFSSKEYLYNADSFFKCYRENAPVFYLEKYQCWLITRHADVKKALNDPALVRSIDYSKNPDFTNIAKQWEDVGLGYFINIFTEDSSLSRHHQLIATAFKPKKIHLMLKNINSIVAHYFKSVKKGGVIDFAQSIIIPIPGAVIRQLLGINLNEEEEEKFRLSTTSIVSGLMNPLAKPEIRLQAINSALYLQAILLKEIAERKKNPQQDLISYFVQALENTPKHKETDVIEMMLTLLFGGIDTTIFSTIFAVKHLFEHPDQLILLKSNRNLMENALKELLRFNSAGGFIPKYVQEDVIYQGKTIKKGDTVFTPISSANKDTSVFPNPDILDITRNTDEVISFGYGLHYCLGANLALAVMGAIFNQLLDTLPANAQLISEDIRWETNSGRCSIVYLPIDTKI